MKTKTLIASAALVELSARMALSKAALLLAETSFDEKSFIELARLEWQRMQGTWEATKRAHERLVARRRIGDDDGGLG